MLAGQELNEIIEKYGEYFGKICEMLCAIRFIPCRFEEMDQCSLLVFSIIYNVNFNLFYIICDF
jgi:hypothetical protein